MQPNSWLGSAGSLQPQQRAARAHAAAWRRAAGASAAATVLCMAAAEPAHARSGAAKRPPRVQQILDHLKSHPMGVTSQPLQYDAEPSTQLPPCVTGLSPDDALPPPRRGGGGDEAAEAGPPVRGSPAARDAAYVHALIHRQEGSCDGEFGSGFSNANYWYAAAAAATHPIAPPLAAAARAAAGADPELRRHADALGAGGGFDAPRFVSLCQRAAGAGAGAGARDAALPAFCERVMASEVRLLLDHCYAAAAGGGAR
ncbi:hypothetical protein Rsub_02624 [Raphidocelis subcapitata]|uniref:Uncharacterized protein n=1 Tax=Raphidocelis subcapitata TaxID=307507 RepID=A0A2V0NWH3_9CHLO|nr:hypothetical protein Rsub_02624 [Raphidocelis subcapitata]|eukprot:GBF89920.1 hypothetical protein Rsub_02624 [Raphidocelis subcapitata]